MADKSEARSDLSNEIMFVMTRGRALELDLLRCACGHRENNHFDFDNRSCAHCSCKSYSEQGVNGVIIVGGSQDGK